jgi:hypothetical protein
MENDKNANLTIEALPDTQPPLVKVISPNGGEILKVGDWVTIMWKSLDNVGIVEHRVRISRQGQNGTFAPIVKGLDGDDMSYDWQVTGPATSKAVIQVVAFDAAGNRGSDNSDTPFIIQP